ncbi:MAG TPA: cytochrome C oxidase subunit IV family protein [Actinomycetota bacterium]|jgi:cytochrome c oxidase subunit IV|nr:cytochrome C oxidase subunit IV family protein [Actinomycetota bacterium]
MTHSNPLEPEEPGHHPGPSTYVKVAVILAIVTAIEVALSYIPGASPALIVTGLLVMALAKFVLVALYFMHLRFDNPLFRRLFVTGVILALIVFAVYLTTLFARGGAAPLVTGS